MNQLTQLFTIMRDSGLIKNYHYFNRYVNMITHYSMQGIKKSKHMLGKYENHHILPRKIWPEYIKETHNIVTMPNRAHKLVHYFLFKSIRHSSCTYALNQMCRVDKGTHRFHTRLYDEVRREFARLISENNSGRVVSQEIKDTMSLLHSGTNVYRNKETLLLKRFTVGEEPSGWEPFQTGRIHSDESNSKVSRSNKGRIWQYNETTTEIKFDKIVNPGFQIGFPPWIENNAIVLKDYKWMYDPLTGDVIRDSIDNGIPTGYVLGRQYDNKGFQKINNSNLARVVDVKEKKFVLVDKRILPNPRYISSGCSIASMFVIQYQKTTFFNWAAMEINFPELPKYPGKRNMDILAFTVPKKHHNQTKLRQAFSEQHVGETFKDLGIVVMPLNDFTYEEK